MPFKSKAQRKFMYAKHPALAKKWEDKYGSGGKSLPEHVKPKAKPRKKAKKK
jgi:hypothetical protein